MDEKMDILDILKKSGSSLLREDLEFLLTELDTGGYEAAYIQLCRQLIDGLQKRPKRHEPPEPMEEEEETKEARHPGGSLLLALHQLTPGDKKPAGKEVTFLDWLKKSLALIREASDYKSRFRDLIKEQKGINAAFLDQHFSLFTDWEMGAVLSIHQLGDDFLEKYFEALDPEAISRYQKFSEGFFIRHFDRLNHAVVLKNGKNEWRHREKRSRQLDVFLRLKGVRL